MNRDDFDSLVRRLEAKYAHRPAALRRWVVVWVIAGYALLLGWLVPLLVIGGVFLFGAASLLPAPGLWVIVGAVLFALGLIQTALLLSIRVAPPKGIIVTRQSAPGLFQELDRISDATRCRHFHRVYLSPDFNAAVYRTPRLGLFGWSRTSLLIGWPLLMSSTPNEARGVLAHEFAHLSREHGRFGHWLYGLHEMWGRVVVQLQTGESSATIRRFLGVLLWGLNWFWPRLNARMFLLSRAAEYEADHQAAEAVGAEHLAGALWRLDCLDSALKEEFWPEQYRSAAQQTEPPGDLMRRMRESFRKPPAADAAQRWTAEACNTLTDQANTHPSFADRTRAMGLVPENFRKLGFPAAPRITAAAEFFGQDERQFEEEVSILWQKEMKESWRRWHGRATTLQRRLSTLGSGTADEKDAIAEIAVHTPEGEEVVASVPVKAAGPDIGALWERARVLADVDGLPAAEPVLRQLLDSQPTHVYASLMLGQHLLDRDPEAGIQLLRRVITSDRDDAIPQAGALLADHFRRTGAQAELQTIRKHMASFETEAQAARKERSSVTTSDSFEPHDLTRSELEPIVATLEADESVGRAWLAQKVLHHFPHRRLFVLCVEARRTGWWGSGEKDQALATKLIPQVRLPGQTLVIAKAGGFAGIARKTQQVEDALIFEAGSGP